MASKNDITGDSIQTRAASEAYANNYDNIFGKKNLPEGRVAVKDLKKGQIVYDLEDDNWYKVYTAPKIVNGQWEVMTIDGGDVETIFYEGAALWTSEAARDAEKGTE